jgi:hypothetical protein
MKRRHILLWTLLMVSLGLVCAQVVFAADDPLPSWQDSAPKPAIVDFVTRVTRGAGADFVRHAERIATFDNDGTL